MGVLTGDYERHLRQRALQPGTIRRRMIRVRAFERWRDGDLLGATLQSVETFLEGRNGNARTKYGWISDLSCFYHWCEIHGHIERNPCALVIRPKLARLLPRPISEDDLAMALESADRLMRAWLTLGAYAGLRVMEMAGLNRDDVMLEQGVIRVFGKGSKERVVDVHPMVEDALLAWGLPSRGALFTRPRGGRYPPWCISAEVSAFFAGLGIPATAHMLRHRFGTQLYAMCKDIRVVQESLGHASPAVTAGYAAYSRREARDAVMRLPGAVNPDVLT